MKKTDVIKTCYSLLGKVTPLEFDCGRLCNGKCCKGDDNTGMLIFPGEEDLIDEAITIHENDFNDKIAVCSGSCNRNKRPLSCRIYPLFPLLYNEDGVEEIKVVFDYRADCPLSEGNYRFNRRFIKSVKRVGKYLLLNEETAEYYKEICGMFHEYFELTEKLK